MGFFKGSNKKKEGRYDGLAAFDGKDFYAVVVLADGTHELTTTRLKSVGEEFHYAEETYPPHNEVHGTLVVGLPVGGE